MYIFKKREDILSYLAKVPSDKSIGFVPTMGDLHEGHLSLINRSIAENDINICSIFVNPTQFNQKNDFDNYPQVLEKDVISLKDLDLDAIFAPSVDDIYPNGKELKEPYPIGKLEHHIEGEKRPGHFQGVCQVVDQLLKIVNPSKLYLGEKDYQQVAVLQRLIEITKMKTEVVPCPIIREKHGLAMSSRNSRLSKDAFETAGNIYKELKIIRENQNSSDFSELQRVAVESLKNLGFETEYILLVNAKTFEILENFNSEIPMRLLVATWLDGVRLIDNISV